MSWRDFLNYQRWRSQPGWYRVLIGAAWLTVILFLLFMIVACIYAAITV